MRESVPTGYIFIRLRYLVSALNRLQLCTRQEGALRIVKGSDVLTLGNLILDHPLPALASLKHLQ